MEEKGKNIYNFNFYESNIWISTLLFMLSLIIEEECTYTISAPILSPKAEGSVPCQINK